MLNKEQLQASEINDSRVLVLAGPGTGKTTTLVSRYKHLISQGNKPEEIICCTFSRKAVDEIKSRISKEVKLDIKNLPVDTFHSLSIKALNKLANTINVKNPKNILKAEERRNIINKINDENPNILKDLKYSEQLPSNVLKYIDQVREELVDPEDAAIEASEKGEMVNIAYADIYKLYEDHLTDNGLVDFPRMIHYAYKAFALDASTNKSYISQFKHILIDEYQDINFAQKSLIDELLKGGASLWVVGDDDQAIYGWRGSNVKFILNFEEYYPNAKKVVLNTNYRSENNIVIAANNLAKRFVERHEKNIISFGNEQGEVSVYKNKDEETEASKIIDLINKRNKSTHYKDIAILARTNTLPKSVVRALSSANIPMMLKNNVNLFNDSSTKNLLNAAAIASGVKSERGWDKKINPKLYSFAKKLLEEDKWETKVKSLSTSILRQLPSSLSENERKQKEKEVENCKNYLIQYDNASKAFEMVNTLFRQPKDGNGVHIGTIHGAKGLEWETVIVMGCEDDKLPHSLNSDVWEIEEERRIAYVGITRPKTNLYLTWAENRDGLGKLPSPYLNEILDIKPKSKNIISEDRVSKYISIMENFGKEAREHQEKLEKLRLLEGQREKQRRAEFIAENRRAINAGIADGLGQGSGWKIKDTGDGFLSQVGYTAKKDGPSEKVRHDILSKVFNGQIDMPDTLKAEVAKSWSEPNSVERLRKMRNTINTALGAQKAKTNASKQAIEKWEKDLLYIDEVLKEG